MPAEITFVRDSTGKVIELILHQNGREPHAARQPLPALPKEIVLSPEVLEEYVGQYPLTPDFVLTISIEADRVFAQATGQGKAEIFASAKDAFFYKVVDARISFTRGKNGKVEGLVLHQNGRDMPAKKSSL